MDRYNHEGYQDPTAYEALSNVEREEKAAKACPPLVYIASPFAGDPERNSERARGYCRFAINRGAVPLAPHLHYPQFLDDGDAEQRSLGIRFALILLGKCDELWVFGWQITEGMAREIAKAKKRGMPVRYFNGRCEEVSGMAFRETKYTKTNFDVWKETLTPEFIADHRFIVLNCGACPAFGKTCSKYDTTCRGNFLIWAHGKYEGRTM